MGLSQSQPVKSQVGLKELAPGDSPVVDIIAIHGLDGQELFWTAHNGVLWLEDLLPADISDPRVLTWLGRSYIGIATIV
ncbi:hypothetical protein BU17DRAFT_40185 [Hysterangium stoloniferum]|nr:hypothetical protein BU17DRAFT_40185 [Hysterangium stoloniferum]